MTYEIIPLFPNHVVQMFLSLGEFFSLFMWKATDATPAAEMQAQRKSTLKIAALMATFIKSVKEFAEGILLSTFYETKG